MLKKLLKYDLKWCYKLLLSPYVLFIFLAIIARILGNVEENFIISFLNKVCLFSLIVGGISIFIDCVMRNWTGFIKDIYGNQSYLTHTLPASKNLIYLSKILTAVITVFTSFVIVIIGIIIGYLNESNWSALKVCFEQSGLFLNSSPASIICVLLIGIFFEVLFIIMCGVIGILIGYKSNNNKVIKSIVFGYVLNTILSGLAYVIIYILGLVNPDVMLAFKNTNEVSSNTIRCLITYASILYGIYVLIMYVIGNKLLNNGVDVD